MKTKTFTFKEAKGIKIFVYKWEPEQEPKAVVQIAHGMVETAARYERLAMALTQEGYVVYANDHIGHGKTAGTVEKVGHLPEDGFNRMLQSMHQLTELIKMEHPGLDVFLLGHSMGSFLAQHYIQEFGSELKGVVLSGTAGKAKGLGAMKVLTSLQKRLYASNTKAKTLTKLVFGGHNKKFEPVRTSSDWLSRDEAEVDKYNRDPYCGNVATIGFYHELVKCLSFIHQDHNMARIPKNLPIYIFGGEVDPVSLSTKTAKWLIEKYMRLGIKEVTYKFYSGGRHEMLNEINRDEVTGDLIKWLEAHV